MGVLWAYLSNALPGAQLNKRTTASPAALRNNQSPRLEMMGAAGGHILFPYPLVRSCFLADVLLNGPTQMRQPEILPAMKHSSPPPNKSRSRTSKERKDLSPTGNLFLGHKLAGELRILMRLSSDSNPPGFSGTGQSDGKSY